jgi:hypothetical protein
MVGIATSCNGICNEEAMNGIYIEYNKLKPHHIEWLDKCGAKWASRDKFSGIRGIIEFVCLSTYDDKEWGFYYGKEVENCQTADEFCQGVAKRLGIEYVRERHDTSEMEKRTEEYFQKKLADKLAEHDMADALFPQSGDDINVATKEEVKYKHLRECFHWDEDRYILSESFDTVIRAVLKDLPQEYVVCSNESFRYGRFGELAPHDTGNIFQRIGSITEKVEIVKEGYV